MSLFVFFLSKVDEVLPNTCTSMKFQLSNNEIVVGLLVSLASMGIKGSGEP